MKLKWTDEAVSDLSRLYDFLAPTNPKAGARIVQSLVKKTGLLPHHPRIGEKLERYAPREIRRILIGLYEVRYEVDDSVIHILRIWHAREDR